MKPELLNEDFRYMLKRYHDLSLEKTVRDNVLSYVETLRPDAELNVENVIFTDLEQGEAAYNKSRNLMKLDYSRLKDFNPATGSFESGFRGLPGGSMLLHEEIHDLDFSVNEKSREYSNALGDTDTDDPRNAVLEAPTTFEVLMAGWDVRENAVEAFREPLQNLEFFETYPSGDATSSSSDKLPYPYNMGVFTVLSIHTQMMEEQ
ncbi:MAG: hypothetical protein ABEJ36_00310, partial [Candidatus Nanosalina sp.]